MKNTQRHEACSISQPPTTGPTAASNRRETGPCADGLAAGLLVERCTNDGKTSRHKKGRSHTLDTPGDHQLTNAGSPAASRGSQRENHNTQHEHAPAAVQVSERAADENQRPQKQSVGLDHPLHIDHRGMKASLERRQSDIDDRAVDKSHAGTEDGRHQDPVFCGWAAGRLSTHRADYGFVARRSYRHNRIILVCIRGLKRAEMAAGPASDFRPCSEKTGQGQDARLFSPCLFDRGVLHSSVCLVCL